VCQIINVAVGLNLSLDPTYGVSAYRPSKLWAMVGPYPAAPLPPGATQRERLETHSKDTENRPRVLVRKQAPILREIPVEMNVWLK
jgi:hypothetical protein